MKFISCDPGLHGAICVMDPENNYKDVFPMPPGKNYPEPFLVSQLLKQIIGNDKFCAAVERTSARPGQGVCSTHNFGLGAGSLMGILHALGPVEMHIPSPQTWQKWFWKTYNGHGDDTKQRTYQACLLAHPDLAPRLTTIRGRIMDGNVDSVGINSWLIHTSIHGR